MTTDRAARAGPSVFPGATIAERFRIEHLLGRGAMGAVWLARHLTLDVDVAVKFIDAAFRHEKDHRSRFVLEAQSAARINSPHVVNVLDFGEDGGRLYIAMEYLVGEDVGTMLDRDGPLSLEVTARIVAHACRGLSKAHALGIAHRDIKPENLFLCGEGEGDEEGFVLKILDFGVAKSIQRTASVTETTAGQLIGSPAYMSPEQARGLPQIDGRSDLFSLAVVAYHCLTGTLPFGGDSVAEILFGIIGGDAEPVSRHAPALPRALDAWFAQALDKDANKRFQSAKEMAQAFALAVGQHASSSSDYGSGKTVIAARASQASLSSRSLAPVAKTTSGLGSGPRLSLPGAAAGTSNKTATAGVGPALAQLGEVPNVLGVGLVDPSMITVAHHSAMGLTGATFADVAQRAHDALHTFENLEAGHGQALTLHFESASVLLHWVEEHVLVVVGTEQVHPTVLMVTLNTVASKLHLMAKQGGGAAIAFKATLSGQGAPNPAHAATTIALPDELDQVSDRVLSQLTQLFAKPLGALGRLAVQQRLKGGKPTYGTYADFVGKLASAIEDTAARTDFLEEALALVPQARASAATLQQPAAPVTVAAAPSPPAGPPQAPVPPAPKKKRVIIYRGKRMEVDE